MCSNSEKLKFLVYVSFVTVIIFLLFRTWGYDDPYITYRYSKNLANGLGFVYNPGQRILSTTTPLFAIILAVLSIAWNDIPVISVLIGSFSIALSAWLLREISKKWEVPWMGYVGLLLYPTFPLVNSTLSSEIPLYIALILACFLFYLKKEILLVSIISAILVLTRPDGLIVPAVLFIHHLITEKRLNRDVLLGILMFLSVIGTWFAFSWLYFGNPLPVTLTVKQAQAKMTITQSFAEGVITIIKPYRRFPYIIEFLFAFLGLFYVLRSDRKPYLFLMWAILYFLAYSFLGVSRYFWYYAPLVVAFVMLVGWGFNWLSRIKNSNLFLLLILITFFVFQTKDIWRLHTNLDDRLRIYQDVGNWLRQNTDNDDTVGLLEVGIIGYYSNRTMVDFAGLIQPEVIKTFSPSSTYEDAALWTIINHKPDYLVLHDGLFPRVEELISNQCTKEETFNGGVYGYPYNVSIYKCE